MFDDTGFATNTNRVTEIMQPFDDDQNSEIKIEKPMCEIQLSDISIFKEMDGRTPHDRRIPQVETSPRKVNLDEEEASDNNDNHVIELAKEQDIDLNESTPKKQKDDVTTPSEGAAPGTSPRQYQKENMGIREKSINRASVQNN